MLNLLAIAYSIGGGDDDDTQPLCESLTIQGTLTWVMVYVLS